MMCCSIPIYIMKPSTRAPTTEERSGSAPLSTRAEVIDRFSTRGYVSKKLMNEAAYVRLHSELTAARPDFELLVERTGSEEDSWVEYGRKLLDMAETALSRGAIEEGWRHLHTAKRFEVYGLERVDEEDDAPLLQDGTILADGMITAPMIVVVGFAAGYTERMVPSVVAKVTSITDPDKSNESKDQDW